MGREMAKGKEKRPAGAARFDPMAMRESRRDKTLKIDYEGVLAGKKKVHLRAPLQVDSAS
jgi:hypothetical protein